MKFKRLFAEACIAMSVSTLCTIVAAVVLGYANVPIGIPVAYSGDGLSAGMIIKGIIDHGWYLDNPDAGAPFGLSWGPYPMVETSHFLLIKIIGWFAKDYGTTMTAFYLTSFFTSSFAAYVAMRCAGLWRSLATCGAVLFALQTYHFLRGAHLFLSVYFSVPIFMCFAIALMRGPLERLTPRRVLGAVALLLVASGGGVYYAFFGCLLIAAAAVSMAVEHRALRPLLLGMCMIGVTSSGVALSLIPHWHYSSTHASDSDISERRPQESEILGLKLTQLILPSAIHRVPTFRSINESYSQASPLVNENMASSIGIVASLGLVLSLIALLLPRIDTLLGGIRHVGFLNLIAILFATVGGLGTIFAWIVTPQIRGLNRISIVIAFLSICALLLVVQRSICQFRQASSRIAATLVAALALGAFGVWDQTPGWRPNIAEANQASFLADAEMGASVMGILPSAARVYQLPYVKFPESPPLAREGVYGLSRWYLHTSNVAWSYGAMNGTESDQWVQHLESIPLDLRIPTIAASGFDAIMVDRKAYQDAGISVEAAVSAVTGPAVYQCPDQSCAMFSLDAQRLQSRPIELLAVRGNGWSSWRDDEKGRVATATASDMRLLLLNPARHMVHATLSYSLESETPSALRIALGSQPMSDISLTPGKELVVKESVELAPGITSLLMTSLNGDSAHPVSIRKLALDVRSP